MTANCKLPTWLKSRLDEGRLRHLSWVDKEAGVFRIAWVNRNSNSWSEEESEVFLDWERYSGRNKAAKRLQGGATTDYTACKARLRCAINKSRLVRAVGDRPRQGQRLFRLVSSAELAWSSAPPPPPTQPEELGSHNQQQQHARTPALSQELTDAIGGDQTAAAACLSRVTDGLQCRPPWQAFHLVMHHMNRRLFGVTIANPFGALIVGGSQPQQQQPQLLDPYELEILRVEVKQSEARHWRQLSQVLQSLGNGLVLTVSSREQGCCLVAERRCHAGVFAYQVDHRQDRSISYNGDGSNLPYKQHQIVFNPRAWLETASQGDIVVRPHLLLTFGQALRSSPQRLVLWAEVLHCDSWYQTAMRYAPL